MPEVTFFRQARRDGGTRTGIDVDGETMLSRFDEGKSETDPSIVWFVDVTFRGRSVPRDAGAAREFLTRNRPIALRLLNELADEIPAGIDPTVWPVKKTRKVRAGLEVAVACSAIRRLEASRLPGILRDLASRWVELVEELVAAEV
jgi:hypothetical protein